MTDRTSAPGPEDPGRPEMKGSQLPEPEPEPLGSELPGLEMGGPKTLGSEMSGPERGGPEARGPETGGPRTRGSELREGVEMRGRSEMRGPGAGEAPPGPEVRSTMGGETAEGREALSPQGQDLRGQEESPHAPLLPRDESDRLTTRLQHAVAEFVDHPREAVEEADHLLEELTTRFSDAMSNRRRTLRGSWQPADSGEDRTEPTAGTEQLRLALQDYRELTERLLHI